MKTNVAHGPVLEYFKLLHMGLGNVHIRFFAGVGRIAVVPGVHAQFSSNIAQTEDVNRPRI
jgi:hypothetical protein